MIEQLQDLTPRFSLCNHRRTITTRKGEKDLSCKLFAISMITRHIWSGDDPKGWCVGITSDPEDAHNAFKHLCMEDEHVFVKVDTADQAAEVVNFFVRQIGTHGPEHLQRNEGKYVYAYRMK